MNLYNYIDNTKNDEFHKLNALDALVLTRLSYIHFEEMMDILPIRIRELTKYLDNIRISKKDVKLVNLMRNSIRFRDMVIKRCVHISEDKKEEELTAITIILPNSELFISFRGTTKNIYDFKEDMNMSYKIAPSCIDATKYVNDEKKYSKMYLGGHSKGGHLAMYSGIHAKWHVQRKIKKIYNFDGPGFLNIDKDFKKMKNKIVNYFPEHSIVGRIMNNEAETIVIKTNKKGIEAHNIYNWEVNNNDLIIGKLTDNSNLFHEECIKVLAIIPKEKREEVINYLFTLMLKGEIKSVKELNITKLRNIINKMPHLLKKEKQELFEFFKILIKCSINNPIKNQRN